MFSKLFIRRFLLLILFIEIYVPISAQHCVDVKLTIVSKQSIVQSISDVGLLVNVINITDQNLAIYTPIGKLVNYIKFYKFNVRTREYQEIVHPYYQEFEKKQAFKDSIFNISDKKIIVDFLGIDDYNWQSDLYKEFVKNDSLKHDYEVRSTQYEKNIKESDIKCFKFLFGVNNAATAFTLLQAKERYQDFFNINFLYKSKGNYKIVLQLPKINLGSSTCSVGGFIVQMPQYIVSNEVHLSVE